MIIHTKQNKSGLEALAKQCQQQGAQVSCQYGDLTKPETIAQLVNTLKQHSKHLTGLVCNAGFPDWRGFSAMDNEGLT